MQPYVIKQGDYLAALAHRFGFDADTVWNDDKNTELRQARPSPNVLYPSDILYIPDQVDKKLSSFSLSTGSTNTFVTDAPTVTLTQRFIGDDASTYASRAYVVQELDQLTGLSTDENGIATFPVPVTLGTVTIVFGDTGESWALSIGAMDPIDTMIGIFRRLQILRYLGAGVQFDTDTPLDNINVLRAGLHALRPAQAAGGEVAPDSTPSSSPSPASADESSPDSAPGSSPSPDSAPASSSPDGPNGDDCGLADDGTLDTDTTTLLRQAYGC